MSKTSKTSTAPAPVSARKEKGTRSPKSEKKVAKNVIVEESPVEETVEETPVEKVPSKNLIKKEPAVIRLDDGFSAGAIINVLRSYYREHPVIDGHKKRTINIHLANENTESNLVDLTDYTGLFAFIDTYIKLHQKTLDERNAEAVPVPFSMSEVIDSVFDMRLRGALHIADTFKGLANTEEMKNVMETQILPDLGFEHGAATDLQGYLKALHEFISNDERIKTKIYNTVFPHTVHRTTDLPKGVNVVYLRNMCRFDNAVLEHVINSEEFDLTELCKIVQKEYINSVKESKGIAKNILADIVLQCANPKIIEFVITPPEIVNSKGNSVEDVKWVEKLGALVVKNGKATTSDTPISAEIVPYIRTLVKELTTSINVARTVHDAMQNPVVLQKEGDKEVSVKDEREFGACFDEYKSIWEDFDAFRDELMKVKVPSKEVDRFTLVMNQFIRIANKLYSHKCYTNPIVQLVNDVKRNDLGFNFGKDLRADLIKMIEEDDVFTQEHGKKYMNQFKYFTSSKAHDPFELDVYSRIGRLCGMMLKKEYKILIGVAIMSFVQESIKRIALADTKKDLNVYIKTDTAHAQVMEMLKDVAVKREIKKKE